MIFNVIQMAFFKYVDCSNLICNSLISLFNAYVSQQRNVHFFITEYINIKCPMIFIESYLISLSVLLANSSSIFPRRTQFLYWEYPFITDVRIFWVVKPHNIFDIFMFKFY